MTRKMRTRFMPIQLNTHLHLFYDVLIYLELCCEQNDMIVYPTFLFFPPYCRKLPANIADCQKNNIGTQRCTLSSIIQF